MTINDLLRSSIIGRDFVNYRRTSDPTDRECFSGSVRSKGLGQIPIIVDSVDKDLSLALATKRSHNIRYGLELIVHMDLTVADLINVIQTELQRRNQNDVNLISNTTFTGFQVGLEDGTIPELQTDLGTVYKNHKNPDDNILYILITPETSVYSYVMSIIRYLLQRVLQP